MVRLRFQRRRAQNGRLRILVIRNDPTMVVKVGGIILQKKHKNAKTIPVQEFKCSNSTRIIGPYGGTRFALPRP